MIEKKILKSFYREVKLSCRLFGKRLVTFFLLYSNGDHCSDKLRNRGDL